MTSLGRRALIGGGLGLVAAGCTGRFDPASNVATPTSSPTPAAPSTPPPTIPARPQSVGSVDKLLRMSEFVVAHRGSGDNWPEHTLTAYLNGLRAGGHAVEISVRAIADGDLICFHDADTGRVTGTPGQVNLLTALEIASQPIDARPWLGPRTPMEPVSRVADVLGRLPEKSLAFVEDKDGTNTKSLLDLLDAQPRATERYIWKQWAPAGQVQAARARGYRCWGYLTNDVLADAERYVDDFDAFGVHTSADDDQIAQLVDLGLPVISWPVHTRSEATRLRDLGVAGLMCSNVPYVTETTDVATRDTFASGLRATGDLPLADEDSWQKQPVLDPDRASLTLGSGSAASYLLGSMAPITADRYTIDLKMRWRARTDVGAGLAFGLDSDAPYRADEANEIGGYRLRVERSGKVALSDHPANRSQPTVLDDGELDDRPQDGWRSLQIRVTPSEIDVRGADRSVFTVRHDDHRGGYLWLWTESTGVAGVEFADIAVSTQ